MLLFFSSDLGGAMEIKACIFFLSFLLLTIPFLSKGEFDSGVYDIDYRGPETHSQIPPPYWIKHRHHPDHPESSSSTHRKFKGARTGNGQSEMKVHG